MVKRYKNSINDRPNSESFKNKTKALEEIFDKNGPKRLKKLSKNKLKLRKLYEEIGDKKYTGFKYGGVIYKINDVLIINSSDGELYGKLTSIIPRKGMEKYSFWPSIEVQWLYKKEELDKEKNHLNIRKNYDALSENELFQSQHKDNAYIETVLGKAKLLSLSQYDNIIEVNDNTFFTRANYDHINIIQ